MPWKECNRMDERLRFVARLLEGEKMAAVCREFGISRKTGYKIWVGYRQEGLRRFATARGGRHFQPDGAMAPAAAAPGFKRRRTLMAAPRAYLA